MRYRCGIVTVLLSNFVGRPAVTVHPRPADLRRERPRWVTSSAGSPKPRAPPTPIRAHVSRPRSSPLCASREPAVCDRSGPLFGDAHRRDYGMPGGGCERDLASSQLDAEGNTQGDRDSSQHLHSHMGPACLDPAERRLGDAHAGCQLGLCEWDWHCQGVAIPGNRDMPLTERPRSTVAPDCLTGLRGI